MMRKNSLVALIITLLLVGCAPVDPHANSIYEFSHVSQAADFVDQKELYINEDLDLLTLDGTLKLKNGQVVVRIEALEDGLVLWETVYTTDAEFQIVLHDLTADTELSLVVETTQSERMKLTLSSPEKLVQNVAKPEPPEHNYQPKIE